MSPSSQRSCAPNKWKSGGSVEAAVQDRCLIISPSMEIFGSEGDLNKKRKIRFQVPLINMEHLHLLRRRQIHGSVSSFSSSECSGVSLHHTPVVNHLAENKRIDQLPLLFFNMSLITTISKLPHSHRHHHPTPHVLIHLGENTNSLISPFLIVFNLFLVSTFKSPHLLLFSPLLQMGEVLVFVLEVKG